jgi:hypothetical protein
MTVLEPDRPTNARLQGCLWCSGPMAAGQRGSPRRFCSGAHRSAFHSAARRFVSRMIGEGRLSVADLHGARKACTLQPWPISAAAAGRVAKSPRNAPRAKIRILWAEPALAARNAAAEQAA